MTLNKNFVAPALPLPGKDYDDGQQRELLRALRLYFNRLDDFLSQVATEVNDMQVPFYTRVAQGTVPGYSSFSVFGYNPDVDQTEESVWPDGGVVPHPTTDSQLTIVSTSTDDDGSPAGTGARTVYIEGLDENYEIVSETVTMNGTTGVTTTNSYMYVNQFYVVTVGTGGANAGEITAKVSTTLYDLIATGYNTRTTAHYCVPAGYTAYLSEGIFTAGQDSGTTGVTGYLKQHGPDGIVRVGAVVAINNGSVQYDFANPYVVPEKNCIGASAVGSSNNNLISAYFNILLVQDGF
jgi:hypothetical protein